MADISEKEPDRNHDKNETDPPFVISYCFMDAVEKGQSCRENTDNAIKENKCGDDRNDLVFDLCMGRPSNEKEISRERGRLQSRT